MIPKVKKEVKEMETYGQIEATQGSNTKRLKRCVTTTVISSLALPPNKPFCTPIPKSSGGNVNALA